MSQARVLYMVDQSAHLEYFWKNVCIETFKCTCMLIWYTSGFWPRVRARALRAPVFFWAYKHAKRGAARPPPMAASLLLIHPPKIKNKLFPETKCSPSGPNSGRGRLSFHWAKLHPTELHCILLSYATPSWTTLNPNKLNCTLLSYATPY
jgi:hypothetical protein